MVDVDTHPAKLSPNAADAAGVALAVPVLVADVVVLVSDDRALVQRLTGELQTHGLTLQLVPLTGQAAAGPLRLSGDAPVLVDLCTRPEQGLSAIERARLGLERRVILALCDPHDVVTVRQALAAGADDFCLCSAPGWEVHLRLARVAARLAPSPGLAPLVVGDLELDPRSRSVRRRGKRLKLSSRQFELLHVLMRHAGEVLSQARLMAELGLRGTGGERASNLIEVHVYHLRQQIGGGRLSTVRGRGYVLHATSDTGN